MEKKCENCTHYRPAKGSFIMGTCEYPVPAYVRLNTTGGFVSETDGAECALYVSTVDAASAALQGEGEKE